MSFREIWTNSKTGGCAAKLGPAALRDLCAAILPRTDPNLLVGMETSDDAAVYRLTDELALVQTVDFITPIFEDPFLYGQVAAANALSDVWAMGGRPLLAMNVCCFPTEGVDCATFTRILDGGLSKIEEAGATLVGGHTIRGDETIYGLCVTGIVHPERLTRNSAARTGDRLILTKPLGSGVHVTGAKRGLLPVERLRKVIETLAVLNRIAGETMAEFGVRAATDVTGFGLGGHALRIAEESGVGVRIFLERLPLFPDTLALLERGVATGVTGHNAAWTEGRIRFDADVTQVERLVLADPQTSGGLLIAVGEKDAGALLATLHARGVNDAALVGEVFAADSPRLEVVKS